jgi:hypothetical protein
MDADGVETAEEQAAGAELERAIVRYALVSGIIEEKHIVDEWMIVASAKDMNRPTYTRYVKLYQHGWIGWHNALGLVAYAQASLTHEMNEQGDDD